MSWCAIESDPGVLTEVIQQMHVKGVRVEELYSLDSECINDLLPVYGLIFLCKSRLPENDNGVVLNLHDCSRNLFFAKQQINNGCATQAIISILMNCPQLDIGPQLLNIKDFSRDFPPVLKALSITNNDAIRDAHNSFAKPEPDRVSSVEDGVYTFINYVPIGNKIYELDGLKEGPICVGEIIGTSDSLDWLNVVRPIIQQRVDIYMENKIDFSVLAVIKDRKEEYTSQLKNLQSRKEQILKQLTERMEVGGNEAFIDSLRNVLRETNSEVELVKQNISMEDEKIKKWRTENEIRKHNYMPFIFNLFKTLAEKGKLNQSD